LECTAYLISNISLLRKKMAKDEGFLLLSEMNDIEDTPVSLAIHPHYIGSPEDTGLSLVFFFFFFFFLIIKYFFF
jgi:hypothetical protein